LSGASDNIKEDEDMGTTGIMQGYPILIWYIKWEVIIV